MAKETKKGAPVDPVKRETVPNAPEA